MRFRGFCVVILSVSMFCSCGSDTEIIPNQKTAIESFLGQKEYTVQEGVYKFVANSNRDGYDNAPMAIAGDSVIYNFEAYTFISSPEALFYTNKPEVIKTLTGLNSQYWIKEPLRVKVGTTPMMKGLANGLPYCKQGDSVVLFITSDLAYGDKQAGIVQSNTALMYILNIENVKK